MYHYYLNKNKQPEYAGGNYELHKEICVYYYNHNAGNNFDYVGYFDSDKKALVTSKIKFPDKASKIDGCKYCCPSIHKD